MNPNFRMYVVKYLAKRMYGFLRDNDGREAFFHLGSFVPSQGEEEPVPPIPGEWVDVDVDFSGDAPEKAPRATSVRRTSPPPPLRGKVDKFDPISGYGFVSVYGPDGKSNPYATPSDMFFLHRSEIRDSSTPLIGDEVEFYAGKREGKPRACHVMVLTGRRT